MNTIGVKNSEESGQTSLHYKTNNKNQEDQGAGTLGFTVIDGTGTFNQEPQNKNILDEKKIEVLDLNEKPVPTETTTVSTKESEPPISDEPPLVKNITEGQDSNREDLNIAKNDAEPVNNRITPEPKVLPIAPLMKLVTPKVLGSELPDNYFNPGNEKPAPEMKETASSVIGAVYLFFATARDSVTGFVRRQSDNAICYYNDAKDFLSDHYSKAAEKTSNIIESSPKLKWAHATTKDFVEKNASVLNHLAIGAGAGIATNSAVTLLQGKTKQPTKEAIKLMGAAGLIAFVTYGTAQADQSSALKLTALISALIVTAARITTTKQVRKHVFRLKTLRVINP